MLNSATPISSKPKLASSKVGAMNLLWLFFRFMAIVTLISTALSVGSAEAAKQFFVKGTFNSWLETNPLERVNDKKFQSIVSLPPGKFEFKIADRCWGQAYSADSTQPKLIRLNTKSGLSLAPGTGNNSLLEVQSQAAYLFEVVFSGDVPSALNISKIGPWVPPNPPFSAQGKIQYNREFNVHYRVDEQASGLRSFDMFSDAPQRDGSTSARQTFSEQENWPQLRSGSVLVDALFANAVFEAQQNETRYIRDGAFNRGSYIPCDCYITGEKWGYVWTRDTAYASNLGLGWLNNEKTWNSLAFKISGLRGWQFNSDDRIEIVQDTGTGGSWPVSTDRVTWALGAGSVLENMPRGALRSERLNKAFNAVKNTLERDRIAVFSVEDELYKGEQSFLDWREQSYPYWTRSYVTAIADGKSLSTNIAHLAAMEIAAAWANELGFTSDVQRYTGWAVALRAKIKYHFFNNQTVALNSLRVGSSYPITLEDRFDLLGTSLAILEGIVSPVEASKVLAKYPISPAGSPVIWPQSPEVPIYHNRSIWPFVSAYAARAGAQAKHAKFTNRQLESIVSSAALHLSNMENLEFTSGRAIYFEGDNTGPVINSRRQLWSVAAFLSIVRDTVFGVAISGEVLEFKPFLPLAFAQKYFANSNEVRVNNFPLQGKKVGLVLRFNGSALRSEEASYSKVKRIVVDGLPAASQVISIPGLRDGSIIEVELEDAAVVTAGITELTFKDVYSQTREEFASYLAPTTPQITRWQKGVDGVLLTFDRRGANDTSFDIYRNGKLVVGGFAESEYKDRNVQEIFAQRCYVIVQKSNSTKLASHPSPESCLFVGEKSLTDGAIARLGIVASPLGFQNVAFGKSAAFQSFAYTAFASKKHVVSLEYSNSYNDVSTGITAATRKIKVIRETDGKEVFAGIVTMPHLPRWDIRSTSSALLVNLEAGQRYRFELEEFFNMSNLSHYLLYDGAGGKDGPVNSSTVQNVYVSPLEN